MYNRLRLFCSVKEKNRSLAVCRITTLSRSPSAKTWSSAALNMIYCQLVVSVQTVGGQIINSLGQSDRWREDNCGLEEACLQVTLCLREGCKVLELGPVTTAQASGKARPILRYVISQENWSNVLVSIEVGLWCALFWVSIYIGYLSEIHQPWLSSLCCRMELVRVFVLERKKKQQFPKMPARRVWQNQ